MRARRTYGVMTERWGWQPTAWMEDGVPTWSWGNAPRGLLTVRQVRTEGLCKGGAAPVGKVVWRGGRRWALLWDRDELSPKRVCSSAQLAALGRAMAARRWCPEHRGDAGYCIPLSLGMCVDCAIRVGAIDMPAEVAA